jgi:hypothetical protein
MNRTFVCVWHGQGRSARELERGHGQPNSRLPVPLTDFLKTRTKADKSGQPSPERKKRAHNAARIPRKYPNVCTIFSTCCSRE